MITSEIIIYILCFIGFIFWTAIVFAIAYRISFKKGYDEGIKIGSRRLDRQNKIINYNTTRDEFRKRRYLYE